MKKLFLFFTFILLFGLISAAPVDERTNCVSNGDGTASCSQSNFLRNYYDGNSYQVIDTGIVVSDYMDYDYEMEKAKYKAYFKSDPTQGQVVKFIGENSDITFQPMSLKYTNDLNQIQQISMINSVSGTASGNSFIYEDAYGPGLDLEYNTRGDMMGEALIINSLSDLPAIEQYMLDGGNVRLTLDYIISTDEKIIIDEVEWNKKTDKTTSNTVKIKNSQGDEIYQLNAPYVSDLNSTNAQVQYSFKKSGSSLFLSKSVLMTDMQDMVYPVRLDPEVGFSISGSAASVGSGDCTWNNLGNVLIFNDAFSECTAPNRDDTEILEMTNYSFDVPLNALSIDGIETTVRVGSSSDMEERLYQLIKNGVRSGTNRWSTGQAPTALTNVTFGGPTDLWALSWTPEDINNVSFGIAIMGESGSTSGDDLRVAWGGIIVTYTAVTDPVFPLFTEIVDNQGEFTDFGFVDINYTINNTNFTFGITFDGTNQTCTNTSAQVNNGTTVNCNFFQGSPGTFNYFAWGLGNGTEQNYNQSATQTYTISEAGEFAIRNFTMENSGIISSLFWLTNKFNAIFDMDVFVYRDLDINGTAIFRDNVTITDFIGQSKFVISDTSTGQLSTAAIVAGDLPASVFSTFNATYDAINSSQWTTNGSNIFYNLGSVGIGTGDPDDFLEISGSLAGRGIHLDSSSGAGIEIDRAGIANAGGVFWQTAGIDEWFMGQRTDADGDLYIKNGDFDGVVVMTFDDTTNNVGIGTSTPTHELNVVGDVNTTGELIVGGNISVGGSVVISANETCSFFYSPDGSSVIETCNV